MWTVLHRQKELVMGWILADKQVVNHSGVLKTNTDNLFICILKSSQEMKGRKKN
jgi:hypothetical protein